MNKLKSADNLQDIEEMYSFEKKRIAKFRMRLFLFIAIAFGLGMLWGNAAHADTLIDMNHHIRFETMQGVSFTLASSFFLWLVVQGVRAWLSLVFRRPRTTP